MLSAACLVVVASVLQGRRPTDAHAKCVLSLVRQSVNLSVPRWTMAMAHLRTHMLCSYSPRDDDALVTATLHVVSFNCSK